MTIIGPTLHFRFKMAVFLLDSYKRLMYSLGTCPSLLSMFRPSKAHFIRRKTNEKVEEKKLPNICYLMQKRKASLKTTELSNGACLNARKRPFACGSKKTRVGNCTPARAAVQQACECKLQRKLPNLPMATGWLGVTALTGKWICDWREGVYSKQEQGLPGWPLHRNATCARSLFFYNVVPGALTPTNTKQGWEVSLPCVSHAPDAYTNAATAR